MFDWSSRVLARAGDCLQLVNDLSGEVFALPAREGVSLLADYRPFVQDGWQILAGDCVVVPPKNLVHVVSHEEHTDTSASPDFVPSMASAFELQMRRMVESLVAENRSLGNRVQQLARAQVSPGPVVDSSPVVESSDE
jgi:hypothetical protein